MLYWAVMFLIIALVSGLLGFRGISSTAKLIAKVLFVIFLGLALVTFLGA